MPDAIEITQARPRDLPAIHAMIRALSAYHGDIAAITLEQTQRQFFDPGAPAEALVARLTDGTVIGYAALLHIPRLDQGRTVMNVEHLFVAERHRNKGVGRALFAAAEVGGRAANCLAIGIGTHPYNAGAQAAYRAMGLEEMSAPGPSFRRSFT